MQLPGATPLRRTPHAWKLVVLLIAGFSMACFLDVVRTTYTQFPAWRDGNSWLACTHRSCPRAMRSSFVVADDASSIVIRRFSTNIFSKEDDHRSLEHIHITRNQIIWIESGSSGTRNSQGTGH
jgi:hypothetical protein